MAGPQSVAEVEQLIEQLYLPGPPQVIHAINEQLQRLQLSQDGWKLADELMASKQATVRFFAALTFTIKLNNDGPSLDEETARSVLTRLIFWLIKLMQQGESDLVCKKLCSTLTTYFLCSPLAWERPLLSLTASLHQRVPVIQVEHASDKTNFGPTLSALDGSQLKTLLWFMTSLAQEASKTDSTLITHARIHEEMRHSVSDAGIIIKWAFAHFNISGSHTIHAEALHAFSAWVSYAQPVWARSPEPLQHLRDLVAPAAQNLLVDSLRTDAISVFLDILESYTSFFQKSHVDLLAELIHEHIQPNFARALSEHDPEANSFAQLVIAFGCAYVETVVEHPDTKRISGTIIRMILDILEAPGYPGDEDMLSIQSIEFWNTYVEHVNDTLYSQEGEREDVDVTLPWAEHARRVSLQAVDLLWKKAWIPPSETQRSWGADETDAFKEFRLDSSDLMLSFFILLGSRMIEQLVGYTLQCLQSGEWRGVEAALFFLNGLADNVMEAVDNADLIGGIFRSSLFRDIADFSQVVPLQARRTAIDILGSYGHYIELHAEFLPDTLRFLFASLENNALSNTAAKAIASLCATCRNSLTEELDGFLLQYRHFLELSTADAYTKEKVLGAIATIVQALKPESAKLRPLSALIDHVEKDIALCEASASEGDQGTAEKLGINALQCLASIGKGLQAPEDIPINIYDDDEARSPDVSSYWEVGEGQAMQQRIIRCLSVLQIVGHCSEAIDAACQVIRSGFTESTPGPFVLPPSVVVSFVQQCSIQTPQLDIVLATAGTMITQHSRSGSKRIDADVAAICGCAVGFVLILGQAANDPVVAGACISVLTRIMPCYTHILLGQQSPNILEFTLSAINGPDSFSKKAALEFWAKLLKPQTAANSIEAQQKAQQAVQAYGPKFVAAMTAQVCGHAQRSELDWFSDPLRVLLQNQVSAQAWLQQSLLEYAASATIVSSEDCGRFARQLVSLRGNTSKMKPLVKSFWAACRGTVVSYA